VTGVDGLRGVPTNAELADRAKARTAHEIIRGWLERHRPFDEGEAYQRWLDWAADNFLADPEITAYADRVARERAAEELLAAANQYETDAEIVSALADQAHTEVDLAGEAAYAITASDFRHIVGRIRARAAALADDTTGSGNE
jgi:hypothetical protein